jgi:hypothetical protein
MPAHACEGGRMSKKTRHTDNSKRPQPMQQQRAQAHQANMGPSKASEKANPQPGRTKNAANDNRG